MAVRPSKFRCVLLNGAAILFGIGGLAHAQTSSGPQTIEVTGFRSSVTSSIQAKKSSNNMVDAITADDIASFPDANIAEAVQRIPGVSINRDGGEGREISVRGLPEDFIETTMDGVEAYSATTGSTLGSLLVNRNRGFDYSTFAADLFNKVTVYKTQSAELNEGSIAATVDLQTPRPFDFGGFHVAGSAEGAHYEAGGPNVSPRLAGLVTDTWLDGKLGALFSVAYNTRTAIEDGYSDTSQSGYSDVNGGFCTSTGTSLTAKINALSGTPAAGNICWSHLPSNAAAYNAVMAPNIFMPKNPGLGRFENKQKRLGYTGSLQWAPYDGTVMSLDAVFSQYDEDQTDFALSQASNNRSINGGSALFPQTTGVPDTQIEQVGIDGNGQVNYMLINNADIKHIQELHNSKTESWALVYHFDHEITSNLKTQFVASATRTSFDLPFDYFVSFDHFGNQQAYDPVNNAGNVYSWDARSPFSQKLPSINYGYDVTNVANVTFVPSNSLGNPGQSPDVRIFKQKVENSLLNFQLSFDWTLNSVFDLKFGAQHKEFQFYTDSFQRTQANNSAIASLPLTAFNFTNFKNAFPSIAPLSTVLHGFGKGLGLPANSVTGWVAPNVSAFIKALGLDCNCINSFGDWTISDISTSSRTNTRTVNETDNAAFAQLNYAANVFRGMKLRGDLGLRYVETNEQAAGLSSVAPFAPITATRRYTNPLPSFNAALEITPEIILRVAAAKVMSRPQLANLTPGVSAINTAAATPTITVGNIDLDPFKANNTDFSLEWYPGTGTLLSLAYFYKDVTNYPQQITALEPFGVTGLPTSLLGAGQTASTIYNVTTFRNTPGGYIKGWEFNYDQPFTFLPPYLRNFGVLFNYTRIQSQLGYFLSTTATTPYKAPFVGVSPKSYNATAYYDDGIFQARVSVAHRAEFIQQAGFIANLPDVRGGAEATNVDAAASWNINKHVQLKFDAINLTNQGTDDWSGQIRKSQRVTSVTGRQYFFGLSMKY